MLDGLSEPMPQPGETGASASITLEIVIDSYPSLLAARGGGTDPVDAIQNAVEAAILELPGMVTRLADQIMADHPVRVYLADDDEDDDEDGEEFDF